MGCRLGYRSCVFLGKGVTDALMDYGMDASTIELQGGARRGGGHQVSQIIQTNSALCPD